MVKVVVLVGDATSDIKRLTSSGNVLDLSIACKSIKSFIDEALAGYDVLYSTLEELDESIKRVDDDVVVLVDALALYTNLSDVVEDLLDAYASKSTDALVGVSPLLASRGFNISVENGKLAGLGGPSLFAGLVVAKRSKIQGITVQSWRDLLEHLVGTDVQYVRGSWIRLEKPYDILVYLIMALESLKERRISVDAQISPTAVIEGPVYIGRGARIDHYAVIKGPAVICENSFVGLHATVRSFTSLEPGSRIGACSEAYVAYLGRRATLSSHVYITGSVVGEEAKIEPFVTTKVVYGRAAAEKLGLWMPLPWEVRAGAVIEAGARVNAGTVLEPFTKVRRTGGIGS